ncbi:hypothetical protein IPH25_03375 [bacterium]|nr:MAG: hypothetical protein IPG37_00365 [bacterium]QQR61502.1 MAG: hypothetical protein IPH25_03375 [bacterium]
MRTSSSIFLFLSIHTFCIEHLTALKPDNTIQRHSEKITLEKVSKNNLHTIKKILKVIKRSKYLSESKIRNITLAIKRVAKENNINMQCFSQKIQKVFKKKLLLLRKEKEAARKKYLFGALCIAGGGIIISILIYKHFQPLYNSLQNKYTDIMKALTLLGITVTEQTKRWDMGDRRFVETYLDLSFSKPVSSYTLQPLLEQARNLYQQKDVIRKKQFSFIYLLLLASVFGAKLWELLYINSLKKHEMYYKDSLYLKKKIDNKLASINNSIVRK